MNVLDELRLPPLPEALPRPVIDNHTHMLSTQDYSGLGVADTLRLAAEVGVTRVIEVGCDVASSQSAIDLAQADRRVAAAVAIHPNDAARLGPRLDDHLVQLAQLVERPGVVAVGETGLDYYRTRDERARRQQEVSFRQHIDWARRHDKTLVIHDRDAHADILRVLDEIGAPERVVMHCFSGDADFARACLERGFFLSFPGVITFGSAESLREAARATPLDRMLVETDAPYLTPAPCRGKANAPYLLPHTVRFLSGLLGVDLEMMCEQIVANTVAAYGWGDDA